MQTGPATIAESCALLSSGAPVIAVQLTDVRGSAPRGAGTCMYVTTDGVAGTIGGGQLEYLAIDAARQQLAAGQECTNIDIPLGPAIGQCCGGRVALSLTRLSNTARAAAIQGLQNLRASWPNVFVFGAGHVGRAIAHALVPLPVNSRVIDTRIAELARLSPDIAQTLTPLPEAEVAHAPPRSAFIVATHDHALDFLITQAALNRDDAAYVGMIGSKTKRAKFVSWLRDTATETPSDRLICPIAGTTADKRPEVIAALAVAEVLSAVLMPRIVVPAYSSD